jgi:hypothetical protein
MHGKTGNRKMTENSSKLVGKFRKKFECAVVNQTHRCCSYKQNWQILVPEQSNLNPRSTVFLKKRPPNIDTHRLILKIYQLG